MRASERVLPVRPVAGILSLPERLGVGHQAGHRSWPEPLEAAFHALGCAINVQVREAA